MICKRTSEIAYAKINLYLDVTSKRLDGFHDINSVMQSISLFDRIDVEITDNNLDEITCNIKDIPINEDNIAVKAAKAFRKYTGMDFGTKIHIEKTIPFSAGLGGGSSDGAAVIRALNRLTNADLSEDQLIEISAYVGSDLPFCIVSGTCLCKGRGEKVYSLNKCPELHIVIAKKGEGVSTPWAYKILDDTYGDFESEKDGGRLKKILSGIEKNDAKMIISNIYNVFQDPIESRRENVSALKGLFIKNGALAAMMSGSGPSVFGIFDDENIARRALICAKNFGAEAYYSKTI